MKFKNIVKFFLISTVLSTIIILSGCKHLEGISVGNDMASYYRFAAPEDDFYENIYSENMPINSGRYYAVGEIDEYHNDGDPNTVQFIAAEINGLPVMSSGYELLMNNSGVSHGSLVLEKIYVPSTLVDTNGGYFRYNRRNLSIYFCGDSAQVLKDIAAENYNHVLYVPGSMYADFVAYLAGLDNNTVVLCRANVAYMLNSEDMPDYYTTEYYYVDYVEYGEEIVSIPPEPVRKGYIFDGWYKEPECENEWSMTYTIPKPEIGEEFKELRLYAKWIKH